MRTYGIHNDYYEPDKNNKHNYMFDTNIFNALCDNDEAIAKLKEAIKFGFQYFYTNIQIREMEGIRGYGNELTSVSSVELDEKKSKFPQIIASLKIKKTGHMATLAPGLAIMDGSCHIMKDEEVGFVKSIQKGNMKHHEDMIIAESVISKGCILVTNDNKLCKKVKKTYPNAVINLSELLKIIDDMEK